jgi:hypothetical protein
MSASAVRGTHPNMSESNDSSFRPSQALLSAALSGLLCLTAGCGPKAGSSSTADASTSVPTSNGDTPIPSTTCDGGVSPNPAVTSTVVENLTQDQFASMCAGQNGIMEIQPHCGGSNACRGMSYDSDTQTLTEHSCRATNKCGGYSCVVCD